MATDRQQKQHRTPPPRYTVPEMTSRDKYAGRSFSFSSFSLGTRDAESTSY